MTWLECQNCEHRWDYGGDSDHYATCPICKSSVSVTKQQLPEDEATVEAFHKQMQENSDLPESTIASFRDAAHKYLVNGEDVEDIKDGRAAIKKLSDLLDMDAEEIVDFHNARNGGNQ